MLSPARSAWCTKKLNSTGTLIQTTTTEAPQGHMYYIGLDVHKKTISYCVKDASGQVHQEGEIGATRSELDGWMKTLPQPWTVAMEATIFTGWIYDHLLPHAQQVKVAHPLMLPPPPLMPLATALCANNFPLTSRPKIRTARSACVRSSRRRSTMTGTLQQTGLISWAGAGGSAWSGRGMAESSQNFPHTFDCSLPLCAGRRLPYFRGEAVPNSLADVLDVLG